MPNHVRSLRTTSFWGIAKQIAGKYGVVIAPYTDLDNGNLAFDLEKSCVFVRDISIEDYMSAELAAFNGCSYGAIMEVIGSFFSEGELSGFDNEALFVVFCILHECGHYISRKNNSLYSAAAQQEYEQKRNAMKILYGLNSKEYHLRYRRLPQEMDADEFARANLLDALNRFTSKKD